MEPPPMDTPGTLYRRHRFPAEIISHCVWLYFRFCLSYRDIEEMMMVRGIFVTYETIRQWCQKFGQTFANDLRRRRAQPGDKWHLDEVFLKINGQRQYLWGAVAIRTGWSWTFWYSRTGIRPRPNGSFASCSRSCNTFRGS